MSATARKNTRHRAGPSTGKAPAPKPKPKKKVEKIDNGKDYISDMIKTMEDIIMLMKDKIPPDIVRKRNSGRSGSSRVSVLDVYNTYLERYKAVLEITDFKVHANLFLEAYEQNRSGFLKIMDDDAFLLDSKKEIQIWYGKEDEKTKAKNCRLPFSLFYKYTSEMRSEISRKLTGSPEEDAEIQAKSEFTIGSELLYCFILVVREAAGPKHRDYKLWTPIIKDLAIEAHIGTKNNDYRGLDKLVNSVMNAAGRAGYTDADGNPLDETNRPSISGIGGLVDKMLDGDSLGKMIGGMGKNLNTGNPADIGSALQNVTETFLPRVAEILIDATKPPPGVNVTPESQQQAEEMAENLKRGIDKMTETIGGMDLNSMLPDADPGEPESDTDPGSDSSTGSTDSDSELDECSDSDSSDSAESD